MAGWPCMCDWLANLRSSVQTIQTSRLQVMPCSRVLRQLAILVAAANVPNPHVIILQQQAPAVSQGFISSVTYFHCFLRAAVDMLCSDIYCFDTLDVLQVSKDRVRTVTDHTWRKLQAEAPDVQQECRTSSCLKMSGRHGQECLLKANTNHVSGHHCMKVLYKSHSFRNELH